MSGEAVATISIAVLIIISVLVWLAKRQLDGIVNGIEKNSKKIDEQNVRMDERIQRMEDNLKDMDAIFQNRLLALEEKSGKEIQRVEQDLNNLKADLPMIYTLREDFIRSLNNVESKISSIDNKIDKLLQK